MEKRIKQIFILIICMAVFITAMPVIEVRAEEMTETQTASISMNDVIASSGSYGYLYINAANFSSIAGMEFSIHYDENLMTDISYWNGWMAEGSTMDVNISVAGEIKCSLMNVAGMSGSGELIGISFKVNENVPAGTYPVIMTVGEVYDANMNSVKIEKISSKLTVTENTSLETQIYFYTSLDKEQIDSGNTFTYKLCGESTHGLSGGNFIFEYDRDMLELQDISLGSNLQKNTAISSINSDTAGYAKISYADIDAIGEDYGTEYFILTFKAKADVSGETSIKFSANSLTSVSLNALTTSDILNTVKILNPETALGKAVISLQYDEHNSARNKVVVDVLADSKRGIAAGDFTVTYDSEIMQCVAADVNDAVSSSQGAYLVTKEDMSNGMIRFSYVNSKPFTDTKTLLTLTFEVYNWWSGDIIIYASGKGIVDEQFQPVDVSYEPMIRYIDATPIDIYNCNFWLKETSVFYDGTEKCPQVQNDGNLREGVDYEVSYFDNTDVGIGRVVIVGIGSYMGEVTKTFEIIPHITVPSPVGNLKAVSAGKNRVKLTWTASEGAEGYLVYAQKNGKYGYVGMTTKGTTYTDTKALDSDYNFYWVFPYVKDSTGKMHPGGCTKYVYAKGVCPAVTNLKASSVSGGVKLTWTAAAGAEGYLVYGIENNGTYGYVGMTTGTTYTAKKASKTVYNYYWIFPYHKNAEGKMITGGVAPYTYGRAK